MEGFSWFTAVVIFFVYILFDVLYALYVLCVSRRRAMSASLISAALYSLGAYGVMNYLASPFYLIPLALGAFIGTYIAVAYMGDWQ